MSAGEQPDFCGAPTPTVAGQSLEVARQLATRGPSSQHHHAQRPRDSRGTQGPAPRGLAAVARGYGSASRAWRTRPGSGSNRQEPRSPRSMKRRRTEAAPSVEHNRPRPTRRGPSLDRTRTVRRLWPRVPPHQPGRAPADRSRRPCRSPVRNTRRCRAPRPPARSRDAKTPPPAGWSPGGHARPPAARPAAVCHGAIRWVRSRSERALQGKMADDSDRSLPACQSPIAGLTSGSHTRERVR